ncbi:hypothetical protein C5B42_02315 [Candidatus Cerribacteria bacterium 'Amazon FNV 2010 28 9']|uniref:Methyltransferase type 11 domain-containing protein n=1 Tax=Candidatus Cerribacteria bacterium 'Amazon FNV 2010 28 9' TaxID=2081795 RepID=A0A317JP41_9BACT|nr:MAG: hypothetical protein C5B42_02315 [Candidatus Cerribacteria bacterium 'Amazon FNV 2010 28 9']
MSQGLAEAYDKQTVADVFLRYTQNRRLLEILASYIGNGSEDYHIDVGFSGRLALFSCLARDLCVVNLSQAQLDLGLSLLKELIAYYEQYRDIQNDSSKTPASFERALPAGSAEDIKSLVNEQIEIIARTGKTPRAPRTLNAYRQLFEFKTESLTDSTFHTLSMIDVTVHIKDLAPIFREINRVLIPGGVAIVTFYAPSSDAERENNATKYVDQIFYELCAEFSVPFGMIYEKEGGTLYPSRLYQEIAKRHSIDLAESLTKQHWLDLPFFQLHTEEEINHFIQQSGLLTDAIETVPGGMFPAYRRVAIVEKPR